MTDRSLTTRIACMIAFCVTLCPAMVWAVPVTDGMVLWLDATDAETMFMDAAASTPAAPGDAIGAWLDKSGNNYHATQADDLLRPAWDATALNGQPALRFSGAEGDGMLIDDGLTLSRPYTAFIVNQYYGDVQGRTLQGRDANWLHGLWAGNVSSYADGFIGANPPAITNFAYLADTTGTPEGNSTFFVNGEDFATNPAPLGQPGRLGLVSGGMFPAEVSDADISEVVIYNRVLTADELGQVRDHLTTKYGIMEIPPPPAQNVVLSGAVGAFTGGDAGEGLDTQGTFAYAINVGGPADLVVGDANFTDGTIAGMQGGSSPGAAINEANEIAAWNTPAYGDSANDDALEGVMQSIRWNQPPGVTVDLAVEPGQAYKLQLLFAEACCDRGFDIFIEDEMAVDNFNVQILQGGINNPAQGVLFTTELVAGDETLNILLGGENPSAADNNPILSGVTLEVVPEPNSLILAFVGVAGLLGLRRRRAC